MLDCLFDDFELAMFPSPLEVYRFISLLILKVMTARGVGFRPLSRYIGLYRFPHGS